MNMPGRNWFRRLIERVRGAPAAPQDAEAAHSLFQTRYHALRLLLAANTKALELMATMEGAANGADLYGMAFVRSHCTALGVSVFQMVRHLDTLAPEKYAQLFDRLHDIQQQIDEELASDRQPSQAPLVVPLDEVDCQSVDFVGAKMANLGEVATVVGMAVPDGFVISSSAFELLIADNDLQTEIDRLIQALKPERFDELFALSSRLQQLIMAAEIPHWRLRSTPPAFISSSLPAPPLLPCVRAPSVRIRSGPRSPASTSHCSTSAPSTSSRAISRWWRASTRRRPWFIGIGAVCGTTTWR